MYNAAGQLDREHLVQSFAPIVKRVAYHMMARLPPNVQLEDLVQNGMLGLLEAVERFEPGMGAKFETYASQRVRGAMLDGLRDSDWLPRTTRKEMREVEQAISRLEQEHGRPPTEGELAAALGIPLAEYQQMLMAVRGCQLVSLEDLAEEDDDFLERHFVDDDEDPARILEDENLKALLVEGIEALPEREKLLMSLYYEQDLNLREAGEIVGVTESRACQLQSQAIARLRARIFGEPRGKKRKGKKNG